MADISKITLPNGDNYNIKDLKARQYHEYVPLETKTYTDVIGTTEQSNRYCGFFYLKFRGSTYDAQWHVKVRVIGTVPGNVNYYEDSVFDIYGWGNTYTWFCCKNRTRNTSYRPFYYHSLFRVSALGYENECCNWIGFNLNYAQNNLDTSHKRTIEVQLLGYEECTVELQDSLTTPDNIPNRAAHTNWYASSNTSFDNFDAASQGIKQTGDANTTNITNLYRGNGSFLAASTLYRYQMLFQVDEDTLTPLNNDNNVVGTTKTMLTDVEFDPLGLIYYYNTTTVINANAAISAGSLSWAWNGIDLRYTFNCGTTLTANKPLYLVVTPTSNGKCKIANSTPWAQELPTTNDGKWYILLGRTYSTYQFVLYHEHPVFYYNGAQICQWTGAIIPAASNSTPLTSDLIGSAGESEEFSRADHIHPISTELTTAITLEYKLSSANDDPYAGDTLPQDPTEEDLDEFWSDLAPIIEGEQYLWLRYRINYIDGSIIRGDPSCISNVTERVEVATNLANLSNEYYLSSSRTDLVGGAWSSQVPMLSPGHYIWTRIKMETVDGSSSYSDPMLHDALNSIADILDNNNTNIQNEIDDLNDSINNVSSDVGEINEWITTGSITRPNNTSTTGVKITKIDGSTPYTTLFTPNTTEIYENTDKLVEISNKKMNSNTMRANALELSNNTFGNNMSNWRISSNASGFTLKWIGETN